MVLRVSPRLAPDRPSSAISRSTVQRATAIPSRLSANHTLRATVDPVVGGVDSRDLGLEGASDAEDVTTRSQIALAIPGAGRLGRPVSAAAGALRWIAMQVLTAAASFGHSDCERIVGATLAQPVLAVTSLAYVAAGMAVLCWAMRVRAPLAGAAGVALVAVGAGSFAYHGPQPSWAELAHDWPIVAVGAVYAAGLARSRRRQRRLAWATAAGVFALGLAAYAAGRSGSPLCRPDSVWQYHGAWHVLSAAAAGCAARAMAPRPPVSVNQRG